MLYLLGYIQALYHRGPKGALQIQEFGELYGKKYHNNSSGILSLLYSSLSRMMKILRWCKNAAVWLLFQSLFAYSGIAKYGFNRRHQCHFIQSLWFG